MGEGVADRARGAPHLAAPPLAPSLSAAARAVSGEGEIERGERRGEATHSRPPSTQRRPPATPPAHPLATRPPRRKQPATDVLVLPEGDEATRRRRARAPDTASRMVSTHCSHAPPRTHAVAFPGRRAPESGPGPLLDAPLQPRPADEEVVCGRTSPRPAPARLRTAGVRARVQCARSRSQCSRVGEQSATPQCDTGGKERGAAPRTAASLGRAAHTSAARNFGAPTAPPSAPRARSQRCST